MKKISVAASGLLLSGTLMAEGLNIEEAFKNGKINGDITLYSENVSNSGSNKDSGFSNGSVGLNFKTQSFDGFKVSLGFRANHKFSEKEDGDYSDGSDPKAVMSIANISYENENIDIIAGRQEVDLEWMGDFHEAVVGVIKTIPDTTITLGHTNRKMEVKADEALARMERINSDKGASVIDVKYEGIQGLAINPYYYKTKEIAQWYGVKIDFDTEDFGITAHSAKSSEKVAGADDGAISHLELRGNVSALNLAAGYITTDKNGAIGSMDAIGDNINPLEDGNQVYASNADTTYLSAALEINGVALSAIYGTTDYGTNSNEKELDITAEYAIADNLSLSAVYVDVYAQSADDDYDKLALTLAYSF